MISEACSVLTEFPVSQFVFPLATIDPEAPELALQPLSDGITVKYIQSQFILVFKDCYSLIKGTDNIKATFLLSVCCFLGFGHNFLFATALAALDKKYSENYIKM